MKKAARSETFLDFEIRERNNKGNIVRATAQDEYFPTRFIEAIEPAENVEAWGVGPLLDPMRRSAFLKAMNTGQLVARDTIRHLSPTFGNSLAVAGIKPIYQRGVAVDTIEARQGGRTRPGSFSLTHNW